MSSKIVKHFVNYKNAYLLGAGALVAAGGLYYYFSNKGTQPLVGTADGAFFSPEYGVEGGIGKALSDSLGDALPEAVDYDIKLWLQPNEERFRGITEVSFKVVDGFEGNLYLSYHKLHITQIKLNDKYLSRTEQEQMLNASKGFICLRNADILKETVKLTIHFTSEFAKGYGLIHHRDYDSPSGESFIFTSTSVLGSSAIFPVFESPKVRAKFRLALIVPKTWTAISNTDKTEEPMPMDSDYCNFSENEKDPNKNDFLLYKFKQTQVLPFNSLSFAAGKLAQIGTKAYILGKKMNVYAKSSENQVKGEISEAIGNIVKTATARLGEITGVKYPFARCDILILPEELNFPSIFGLNLCKVNTSSPGLTSIYLRDYYNYKAEFVYELIASIVKLWFGNYISIDWWTEIWFTESFARFLAYKIIKENPTSYGLTNEDVSLLTLWLKTQAIYAEIINDVTGTNQALVSNSIQNSYDVLFISQLQSEKVGPFRFEELFNSSSEDKVGEFLKKLTEKYGWKCIDLNSFKDTYSEVVLGNKDIDSVLYGCFEHPQVDEIKFSRTSDKVLSIQRLIREQYELQKFDQIELDFLNQDGESLKKETTLLGKNPVQFEFQDESIVTFASELKGNGIYYEIYDQNELAKLFALIKSSGAKASIDLRLNIARILFTNTFKAKSICLSEALEYLETLMEVSSKEEQKWILRCFSVVAKHIDKNAETSEPMKKFCKFLVHKAVKNVGLVPYLGYFGVFNYECKDIITSFISDFDIGAHYDSSKSILNYDLLKSSILMLSYLRTDLISGRIYTKLVSKFNPSVGTRLKRIYERHCTDLATEHLKIIQELKILFTSKPSSLDALNYYFKSLLVRTEKTKEMDEVRKHLEQALQKPDEYNFGGRNSLTYYNIARILATSKRDEDTLQLALKKEPSVYSPTEKRSVEAQVSRRFTHHFKLM